MEGSAETPGPLPSGDGGCLVTESTTRGGAPASQGVTRQQCPLWGTAGSKQLSRKRERATCRCFGQWDNGHLARPSGSGALFWGLELVFLPSSQGETGQHSYTPQPPAPSALSSLLRGRHTDTARAELQGGAEGDRGAEAGGD